MCLRYRVSNRRQHQLDTSETWKRWKEFWGTHRDSKELIGTLTIFIQKLHRTLRDCILYRFLQPVCSPNKNQVHSLLHCNRHSFVGIRKCCPIGTPSGVPFFVSMARLPRIPGATSVSVEDIHSIVCIVSCKPSSNLSSTTPLMSEAFLGPL